jgi:hypothetical protein
LLRGQRPPERGGDRGHDDEGPTGVTHREDPRPDGDRRNARRGTGRR